MTIAEFLLARIDEDEKGLGGFGPSLLEQGPDGSSTGRRIVPPRVLAECEAKRRIVERRGSECSDYEPPGSEWRQDYIDRGVKHWPDATAPWPCDGCSAASSADRDHEWTLKVLASIYADHPDFREGWTP